MPLGRVFGRVLVDNAASALARGNVFFTANSAFLSNQARYFGGRMGGAIKQAGVKALEYEASPKGASLLGKVSTGITIGTTVVNLIGVKDNYDSYQNKEIRLEQAVLGAAGACFGIVGAWGKPLTGMLCANFGFFTIVHKHATGFMHGQRSDDQIKGAVTDICNAALGCMGARLPGGFLQQGVNGMSMGISAFTSSNCEIMAKSFVRHGGLAIEEASQRGTRAYGAAQEYGEQALTLGRRRISDGVAAAAATAAACSAWMEQCVPKDAELEFLLMGGE